MTAPAFLRRKHLPNSETTATFLRGRNGRLGLAICRGACRQPPRPVMAARTVFSFRQTGALLPLIGSVPCGWLPQRYILAPHLIYISRNFLR